MKIVLIALAVFVLYKYIGFRKKRRAALATLKIVSAYVDSNNPLDLLKLATAYTDVQRYQDAYDCYEKALRIASHSQEYQQYDLVGSTRANMAFCQSPFLNQKGPKNHHRSFIHDICLSLFGKRHCSFITAEDLKYMTTQVRLSGKIK